jgi:hypothetical protein
MELHCPLAAQQCRAAGQADGHIAARRRRAPDRSSNAERRAKLTDTEWDFLNHYKADRAAELTWTEARIICTLMRHAGDKQVRALLARRARMRLQDKVPSYHSTLVRAQPAFAIILVFNVFNIFLSGCSS